MCGQLVVKACYSTPPHPFTVQDKKQVPAAPAVQGMSIPPFLTPLWEHWAVSCWAVGKHLGGVLPEEFP